MLLLVVDLRVPRFAGIKFGFWIWLVSVGPGERSSERFAVFGFLLVMWGCASFRVSLSFLGRDQESGALGSVGSEGIAMLVRMLCALVYML